MWRSPMRPLSRRTGDGVSTTLTLGSGDDESDIMNSANRAQTFDSNSGVHLQVSNPAVHPIVQHAEQHQNQHDARIHGTAHAQEPMRSVAQINTVLWSQIQAAARSRFTTSQRLAVREQILKAWDESEEQIQLNKKLLKALNDEHIQQNRLKKALQKAEERRISESSVFLKRVSDLQAKVIFLQHEGDLQHEIYLLEQAKRETRVEEKQTRSDVSKERGETTRSSCPRCICPHCKLSIHEVVDLSNSESEENTTKFEE